MKLYGVWCKDEDGGRGDWLRELASNVDDGGIALLAFTSIRAAQARAAKHYGYDSYSGVKKDDWCEVRLLA